jgi:hypothetical protein
MAWNLFAAKAWLTLSGASREVAVRISRHSGERRNDGEGKGYGE